MLGLARMGATVTCCFWGEDGQSRVAKPAMAMIATTKRAIFFQAHEAGMAPSRPLSSIAGVVCLVREGCGSNTRGETVEGSVSVYTGILGGGQDHDKVIEGSIRIAETALRRCSTVHLSRTSGSRADLRAEMKSAGAETTTPLGKRRAEQNTDTDGSVVGIENWEKRKMRRPGGV